MFISIHHIITKTFQYLRVKEEDEQPIQKIDKMITAKFGNIKRNKCTKIKNMV